MCWESNLVLFTFAFLFYFLFQHSGLCLGFFSHPNTDFLINQPFCVWLPDCFRESALSGLNTFNALWLQNSPLYGGQAALLSTWLIKPLFSWCPCFLHKMLGILEISPFFLNKLLQITLQAIAIALQCKNRCVDK